MNLLAVVTTDGQTQGRVRKCLIFLGSIESAVRPVRHELQPLQGDRGRLKLSKVLSVAAAAAVFACYAKMARLLGPSGAGQLAKMTNQICIAGLVQALAEGLAFAQAAGLDGKAVVDVISKGAAQSWQMENRYKTMNDNKYDFGFAVEWMRTGADMLMGPVRTVGNGFFGGLQEDEQAALTGVAAATALGAIFRDP